MPLCTLGFLMENALDDSRRLYSTQKKKKKKSILSMVNSCSGYKNKAILCVFLSLYYYNFYSLREPCMRGSLANGFNHANQVTNVVI